MKRTISALLVSLLMACAGTQFSFDKARQVKVGMPVAEVTQLMGPPFSVVSRTEAETWIWTHANGLTGAAQTVSFQVRDGKVIAVPKIPDSFK